MPIADSQNHAHPHYSLSYVDQDSDGSTPPGIVWPTPLDQVKVAESDTPLIIILPNDEHSCLYTRYAVVVPRLDKPTLWYDSIGEGPRSSPQTLAFLRRINLNQPDGPLYDTGGKPNSHAHSMSRFTNKGITNYEDVLRWAHAHM